MKRLFIAIAASVLATAAAAQGTSKPLNLKLPPQNDMPPSDLPASNATISKPASSAPGVYYGDTSGHMGHIDEQHATAQRCDDSTYNQPQVHGSVSTGVVGGNHVSGNYQAGTLSITKKLGDCDHPTGGVNFSVGVGSGHFHGRGW